MPAVLIVDDDKFTRTVLETIFAQDSVFVPLALDIYTAADGEAGLAEYRKHRPDVVIVDLLMPKLDGFGLCKELRAEKNGKDIHIVVMSGIYRDSAISQRVRTEHGAIFFAKPYQLKDLTHHVADLLSSSKNSVTPATRRTRPPTPPPVAQPAQGNVAERCLGAVLLDLIDAKATGKLHLQRGRINKVVELAFGHPTNVTSSIRDETLGHFLALRGLIDPDQHSRAVEQAAQKKIRIGEALIALGALTPEQLLDQLTAQVKYKITRTLRWPDGTWRFEPHTDAPSAPVGHPIDAIALVVNGLRETATLTPMPPHLAAVEGAGLRLKPRGKRLMPVIRKHLSAAFAEAWLDGATIADIIARGANQADAYVALDVIISCDAVETGEPNPSVLASAADKSGAISVAALSQHAKQAAQKSSDESEEELYSTLFEEGSVMAPLPTGHDPIDIADGIPETSPNMDSGYIDVRDINAAVTASAPDQGANAARRALLEEYLRIQGVDHYAVLKVERKSDEKTIAAAIVERRTKFSMDWYSRFDLGRDYAKLEELHGAYDRAFAILLDDNARRRYDREAETTEEAGPSAPTLNAELDYNTGIELLGKADFGAAIARLTQAQEAAPDEAAYHAALGWARFLAGGRNALAADEARPHLTRALVIDPDHADAHEYKGVITTELGNDDVEARFHLERALDTDPKRTIALDALEKVWVRSGELRPLERQYRRLIYRVTGREPKIELRLWLKLAELYRTELDDDDKARVAYKSAARLAPQDASIQAALADLDSGSPDRFYERSEMLRSHWLRDPNTPGPGLELMRAAEQASRPDATFMAASALVARGLAGAEAEALYQRYRPRFVVRAQRELHGEAWAKLRHPDDDAELDQIFNLLAPAAARAHPLTLADLEVDESMAIEEAILPSAFVKVRDYVAQVLGVAVPKVYVRSDFGRQIHVGAIDPPVLLAGDDALAAPERSELAFRLGRAMTYLSPSRALGGSRPSRFLKQSILAAFSLAAPEANVDDSDGTIAEIRGYISELDEATREAIHWHVSNITQNSQSLNLSKWARALARTADRTGLVLCGDLPAAVRFAIDSGSEAVQVELVDFAVSSAHLSLRSQLGLSIDV